MTEQETRTEEVTISGEQLVSTVQDLVRQRNIRRITIVTRGGETLIEIPFTLGVVALLLPTLAALGSIAALRSSESKSGPFETAAKAYSFGLPSSSATPLYPWTASSDLPS